MVIVKYVVRCVFIIVSYCFFFFLMRRRPPRSTRTDTLFPYTTLFRSGRRDYHHPDRAPAAKFAPCQSTLTVCAAQSAAPYRGRSEEHTSELQSLMRISYAVFCLKKKKNKKYKNKH